MTESTDRIIPLLFHCSGCLNRFADIRELQKCSGCRRHHYCSSTSCQRNHWDNHKFECRATQASIVSLKEENKSRLHVWYRRWERNAIKLDYFNDHFNFFHDRYVSELFKAAPNFSREISWFRVSFSCNARSFQVQNYDHILLHDKRLPQHIKVSIMDARRKLMDMESTNYLYHCTAVFVEELQTTYYLMLARSKDRPIDESFSYERILMCQHNMQLKSSKFSGWNHLLCKTYRSQLAYLMQEHGSSFVPFVLQALRSKQNSVAKSQVLVLDVKHANCLRLGAIAKLHDYFVVEHDNCLVDELELALKNRHSTLRNSYNFKAEIVDMELDLMTVDGIPNSIQKNENQVVVRILLGDSSSGRFTYHALDFTELCEQQGISLTSTGQKKPSKKNRNKNKKKNIKDADFYFRELQEIDKFPAGEKVAVGSVELGSTDASSFS